MRDMGWLRRAPRGWAPGVVTALRHRTIPKVNQSVEAANDVTLDLEVEWEVRMAGREPYRVHEERKAPTWVEGGGLIGTGNRWYKVRKRPTHGLSDGVAIPCHVDPEDPRRLWIDWDAGYEAHAPAWDRQSAVDREVARQRSPLDRALNRVFDPFAPEAGAEEQQAAAEHLAAERERAAAADAAAIARARALMPPPSSEDAAYAASVAEMQRVYAIGRPAPATVVSMADTGRTQVRFPVWAFVLDVEDGGTRRVAFEIALHKRAVKAYSPGKRIGVRIDPDDADNVAFG